MAKPRTRTHKHQTISPPLKEKSLDSNITKWALWALIAGAIIIAAIPFCYGKYLEFNTDGAFDGGMNVYTAQCLVNGQKLGVEVSPSARPATLLVNFIGVSLFGFSEFGPKLIQTLMQLTALSLMFYTLRKAYGLLPAAVALTLAAFYLSCPPYAKFGNVKEQFMIACMITAACGLMLHHLGGPRWWLLLSGAAAINIYYFKPTGASVMIAMIIYIPAQLVLRHRTFRQFGSDILYLLIGAAVGFVPLIIFYAWQDQLLPFLKGIPFAGTLIAKLLGQKTGSIASMLGGGEYLKGSKRVSDFMTQYLTVTRYYRSFVVPIGLSLLAIAWRLVRLFTSSSSQKSPLLIDTADAPTPQQNHRLADQFVLLLGLWWLLDMLFIWISPRSYVEYYLPINGSAAMLAAYAVYRCIKNPRGFIYLLALWLIVDFILAWIVPAQGFPYIAFKSASTVGAYWALFFKHTIPLVLTAAAYFLLRPPKLATLRTASLLILSLFMLIWWNTNNLDSFQKKVKNLQLSRQHNYISPWQQLGNYIRDHSNPNDGLYVWGWYPGIYVQAQRFCPSTLPSYSNMHSDNPRRVGGNIKKIVKHLSANPPLFIVDSQKMHYPYNTHPLFDLWPQIPDKKNNLQFLPPDKQNIEQYSQQLNHQVQQYTYNMLTRADRLGGPVSDEKARQLAQTEKDRHQAMYPLRKFVMTYYKPIPTSSSMILFQRKADISDQDTFRK